MSLAYHPDGSVTCTAGKFVETWRTYKFTVDGRVMTCLAVDQRDAEQQALRLGGTRPRVTNSLQATGIWASSRVLSQIRA